MILNDICEVYSGYALKKFNENGDGLPVIKIGNILADGTLQLEDCEYTTEKVHDKYYSKKEDIYVALSGATTGKIGINKSDKKYIINQRVGIVRKKDNNIPNEFIKFFLLRQTERILQEAAGCAQPNISPKQIAQYALPDIRSEKMRQIVVVLNRLTSVIVSRKTELQKLDDLIKARFVELSSIWAPQWKPEPLFAYLEDITYGFTNPMPDADEGPWKITAKDVVDGRVDFKTARKTTQEAYDSLTDKSKPQIGSVLLTKDGTLGRTAVVENENICVNQSVAVLKVNNRVLPRFLEILLRTPEYQSEMLKDSGGGTIKHIYITKVDKMMIMVPSVEQQKDFLKFVAQVDKSKVAVQKSLDETKLLFDSLMQEYFG